MYPEIAGEPDAEELEAAQGPDQVRELALLAEGGEMREPARGGDEGRHGEDGCGRDQYRRLREDGSARLDESDRRATLVAEVAVQSLRLHQVEITAPDLACRD